MNGFEDDPGEYSFTFDSGDADYPDVQMSVSGAVNLDGLTSTFEKFVKACGFYPPGELEWIPSSDKQGPS